jgi:hypothetical protein
MGRSKEIEGGGQKAEGSEKSRWEDREMGRQLPDKKRGAP